MSPWRVVFAGCAIAALAFGIYRANTGVPGREPSPRSSSYAYGSPPFRTLLGDSYEALGSVSPTQFETWWDTALEEQAGLNAQRWIDQAKKRLAEAQDRAQVERQLGKELHGLVKKTIRKFSLDRGFEFCNVVTTGERQCHLQAVLIASMLQAAGLDAGLAMVWMNEKGQSSNLGHAATLVLLANGNFLLVDASEPTPFPRFKGLFLAKADTGRYQFVTPAYNAANEITAFSNAQLVRFDQSVKFEPLDFNFVRSQFDFYRGERTADGLLSSAPTAAGLKASASWLRKSVQECPDNPLAVFSLARVDVKLKDFAEAKLQIDRARKLYVEFGWLPDSIAEVASSIK